MRTFTRLAIALLVAGVVFRGPGRAQKPPLLPETEVAALANELSGETAKRNLEGLARFHRQRGSKGFHEAAEFVAERLEAYGLQDAAILQFPADGKIFYGTQRSRPAWDADFAELWEVAKEVNEVKEKRSNKSDPHGVGVNERLAASGEKKMASYEAEPIVLAEDSESADVTADLADVGEGTKESDYAGKDVKGKIVLVSAQPGAVQDLAVGKFGAAGIVSYAQNQKTAWWGEDENLIRWGHLETFSPNKTFGFMVSLQTARRLRERLAQGEEIRLHAVARAGQHAGNYEVVTAAIRGADRQLQDEEIAFSCHLDHQRPGANDNASGCVTILEVARTLQKLIAEGKLARPARTIRFIWPPEIEGTVTLLNAKPEFAKRIKAVVHMDMVGGGPETKAVFHVTRGPMSLPSFVHDVAWAFAEFVNEESYRFAATGKAEFPLVAPEGGKEPLGAVDSAYTMGSDHQVYQDSSFGIPAIYLNDWPDRYIHTNLDTAANIDPTKLKRAAFIGAASGYFLARLDAENASSDLALSSEVRSARLAAGMFSRMRDLSKAEEASVNQVFTDYVAGSDESLQAFLGAPRSTSSGTRLNANNAKPGELVFARTATPKGPLEVFGYDYFEEHRRPAGVATPKLLSYEGWWGAGEEYAYEVLNFADGQRNTQKIRDAVSAEYGPVPLELVVEYLLAAERIGAVKQVR